MFFVFSKGDLEEKEKEIQELQLEVDSLTRDLANATEKITSDIIQVVAEGEEIRRDLQAKLDAKTEEFDKLQEQFSSLKEDNAKEVCVFDSNGH